VKAGKENGDEEMTAMREAGRKKENLGMKNVEDY